MEALGQALPHGHPEVFPLIELDQGVQSTAQALKRRLEGVGTQSVWMNEAVRWEGLHLALLAVARAHDDICLHDYATVPDPEAGYQQYFALYNDGRPRQSRNYAVPGKAHQDLATLVC